MPENATYVGRPSKWENPFRLIGDMVYIDAGYRRKILDKWVLFDYNKDYYQNDVVALYESLWYGVSHGNNPDALYWIEHFKKLNLMELIGGDLVCWCPLDKKCHVDILLKLLNSLPGIY